MNYKNLQDLIRDVPDFPQEGISYKDITTLLKDPTGLKDAIGAMLRPFEGVEVELVVGIESRGFILATPMAIELGCGFIPVRKPGKLPAETLRLDYDLEYGTDAVEIHADAIEPGQKILVVDDVLATGGTLMAVNQLCEEAGYEVAGNLVLIDLEYVPRVKKNWPQNNKDFDLEVKSLVQYGKELG